MNFCECCGEPASGERCNLCAQTGGLCFQCDGCDKCCDCFDWDDFDDDDYDDEY